MNESDDYSARYGIELCVWLMKCQIESAIQIRLFPGVTVSQFKYENENQIRLSRNHYLINFKCLYNFGQPLFVVVPNRSLLSIFKSSYVTG